MRFLDMIIDVLYPRDPGEPDRASVWAKLFAIGMLVTLLLVGIAANGRWWLPHVLPSTRTLLD